MTITPRLVSPDDYTADGRGRFVRRAFWPVPLVDGYVVPDVFEAEIDRPAVDDCSWLLRFRSDGLDGRPRCVLRARQSRPRQREVPPVNRANAKRRTPDRELERLALSVAACPIDEPFVDAFGRSQTDVLELLNATPRKTQKVTDAELEEVARLYRAAAADPTLSHLDRESRIAIELGLSLSAVRRRLKTARDLHVGDGQHWYAR